MADSAGTRVFATAPTVFEPKLCTEVARTGSLESAYRYDVLPECFKMTNQSTWEPSEGCAGVGGGGEEQ